MTEAVADGDADLAVSLMKAHLAMMEIQLLQNMHAAQSEDVRGQAPGPRSTERTVP